MIVSDGNAGAPDRLVKSADQKSLPSTASIGIRMVDVATVGAASAIDEMFEDDNIRSQGFTLHLGD